MSDIQQNSWSDNPNAPEIPHVVYLWEKVALATLFVSLMLYGTIIALFFKCMNALLSSVIHKREGVRWGLVSYTMVMFLVVTVVNAGSINLALISFIDNREFPGVQGSTLLQGPYGYTTSVYSKPLSIFPNVAALLNYWLADGLLLHRCHVIYDKNPWATAFPCLTYLATVATGIIIIVFQARASDTYGISILHLSISVSLNIFLTLAIVVRIVLHGRNIRAATGSRAGISGLYKTIATMLLESSALYTVTSLFLIGTWITSNRVIGNFIIYIHAETQACASTQLQFLDRLSDTAIGQVIAPLLIIQRVANQSALTSSTIVSGHVNSLHVRSRGVSTGGS